MPVAYPAPAPGLEIHSFTCQGGHGVREISGVACYLDPVARAGIRSAVLDVEHGMEMVHAGTARLHHNFILVVPADFVTGGTHHRFAVYPDTFTDKHRTGDVYVHEGNVGFGDGFRPAGMQVKFTRQDHFLIDCHLIRGPFRIIPLYAEHAQEWFLGAFTVGVYQ